MQFLWPHNLGWMLALPALVLARAWWLRRRRPAMRWVGGAGGAPVTAQSSWRRRLPPALFLVALALLALALARPTVRVSLPWTRSTILLAMDISLSMRVQDVKPTRMVAAQEAAKAFVREVPARVELGLVTFAGTAQVARPATLDRPSLVAAIDAVQMQYGTAIGNAIVVGLAELFPDHGLDLGDLNFGVRRWDAQTGSKSMKPPAKAITPVAPGSYASGVIVLLSDGRRTTGVDTLEAARMAADRGVRIHVVGLGTSDGHAAAAGEGMAIYLQLDEPTLRQVAQMTGGEYHRAATAEALQAIYQGLGSRLQVSARETEITALLALAAAIALSAGAGLSLLWFGRIA